MRRRAAGLARRDLGRFGSPAHLSGLATAVSREDPPSCDAEIRSSLVNTPLSCSFRAFCLLPEQQTRIRQQAPAASTGSKKQAASTGDIRRMVRSASSVEKTARLAQNTAMAKKKLAETKLNLLVKHEASQDRRRVRQLTLKLETAEVALETAQKRLES